MRRNALRLPRCRLIALAALAASVPVVAVAATVWGAMERVQALVAGYESQRAGAQLRDVRREATGADTLSGMDERCESWLERQEGLGYVLVLTPAGEVVAASTRPPGRLPPPDVHALLVENQEAGESMAPVRSWLGPGDVLDFAIPAEWRGTTTYFHLGVPRDVLGERVAAEEAAIARPAMVRVVVALAASGLLTVLALRVVRLSWRSAQADAQRERLAEVGQLASGLVHELRNPLNALRMQLGALRDELGAQRRGSPAWRELVDQLDRELVRLDRLTTEFLRFGRAGTDAAAPIDVAAETSTIIDELQVGGRATTHDVRLAIEPGASGATARLAAGALKQVLLNLVGNAQDASPEGARVLVRVDRPQPSRLRIEVEDEGEGMTPSILARVFEPFFTTKGEGTGLGLCIVKRIVEAAGGEVLADSTRGRGTVVTVELPVSGESES